MRERTLSFEFEKILKIVFVNDPQSESTFIVSSFGSSYLFFRMPLKKGSLNCCRAALIIESNFNNFSSEQIECIFLQQFST